MTTTGRPAPVLPPQERDVGLSVPRSLAISAALGWRMLVVVAALAVIGVVAVQLSRVVVPVAIALLLAALLVPAVGWLVRHRVPRALATALVMVGGVAGLGGVLTFVIVTFVRGIPSSAISSRPASTRSSGGCRPARCGSATSSCAPCRTS